VRFFLVLFQDTSQADRAAAPAAEVVPTPNDTKVAQLQQEIGALREYLQSVIEEQESTNEELKSANEEILSANEELQSTNEELETSREETQSINEELNTVNSELHRKVEELDRTNDDLRNLFESTPIGTVFLNRHMVIRTFTPAITAIFNLIASDRGRPLTDIANDLEGIDLRQEVEVVLRSRQGRERRVVRRGRQAHYLMRILPDNTASADGGALVSFIDITPMVEFEQHLREFNEGADTMLQMVLRIADTTLSQASAAGPQTSAGMSRLRSLGAIYKLLSRVDWHAIALRDLIVEELGELGLATAGRVALSGPVVSLKPKAAIVLGLALHELVSNARQYGSLSGPEGRVTLDWSIDAAEDGSRLVVQWQEVNGPSAQPSNNGLDRTTFEHRLRQEIGAEASLEIGPRGVRAHIALSLAGGSVVLSQSRQAADNS
jgi:two-component system, chemotaxis family, CheB/CheR fusion protein